MGCVLCYRPAKSIHSYFVLLLGQGLTIWSKIKDGCQTQTTNHYTLGSPPPVNSVLLVERRCYLLCHLEVV